jgi:hypothetical protein
MGELDLHRSPVESNEPPMLEMRVVQSAPSRWLRLWTQVKDKVGELFGIDYRTLAMGRVALASVNLADVLMRMRDLRAHYTDFGILPRSVYLEKSAGHLDFSLHMAAGADYGVWLVFGFHLLVATAMLVGYRTTLMTALSWLMLVSMQNRNPMILHGGDVELRCVMFFAMFLPLGARWSLDALRRPHEQRPEGNHLSPASIGILLQVALIYFVSTFHKTGAEWRSEGTAVFLALNLDQFATPFGIWFRQFRELLAFLTDAVMVWEFWGPFLLFAPIFTAGFRTFAMLGFMFMHMNFEVMMGLGIFAFFSCAALLLFMPKATNDWIARRLQFYRSGVWWRRLQQFHGAVRSHAGLQRVVQRPRCLSTDSAWHTHLSRLAQALPLAAIVLIIAWNLQSLPRGRTYIDHQNEWMMRIPRLDQKWDMFSPKPLTEDGWYVIDGALDDGSKVDVYNRTAGAVSWEKPPLVSATYPNERWQKYLMNLWNKKHRQHWLYYGRYVCRSWNEGKTGSDRLKNFEIFFMLERSNPTLASGKEPVEKVSLWRHNCY